MITINLGAIEIYDGTNNVFVYEEGGTVDFEYSLKAMYEWEAKWKKPFLSGNLSYDEMVDFYLRMAVQRHAIKKEHLTEEVMMILASYIRDEQTATKFSDLGQNESKKVKSKIHTAEEIYAIMFMAGIPLDFENRNLNRLLTIIKVIDTKNSPPKKMTKEEVMKQNRELNAQRKQALKTKG